MKKSNIKLIALTLVLVIVTALLPVAPASATDYGQIEFGTTYSGIITDTNSSDLYTVVLTESGRLSVSVTSENDIGARNVDLYLLDSSGVTIENARYGTSLPYSKSMDLEADTYHIRIDKYSNNTGTYYLLAEFTNASNNDIKPHNDRESAQLLSSGETVKGYISYQNDIDYYKYISEESGRLSVNITRENGIGVNNIYLLWLDGAGVSMSNTNYGAGIPYDKYMDLEAGTYYIKIEKNFDYTGTYYIKTTFTSAKNNDIKPHNTRDNAQTLTSNQTVKGYISYQNDTDFYKYVLNTSGKITINITRENGIGVGNINIFLLDSAGVTINNTSYGGGLPYNKSMDLDAGTYYIRIEKYNDYTGTYHLTIQPSVPDQITITATASPTSGGTVTGGGSFKTGDSVTLRATANSGYLFDGWYDGNTKVSTSATYTFSATANKTLQARFTQTTEETPQSSVLNPHSNWATEELIRAKELNLIPDSLVPASVDYTKPITRAEFAAVSVKVYESLSGSKAIPAVINPFTDTNDAEVLKAYNVGISNGTSATKFSPNDLLNREQAATMLTRVFKRVSMPDWSLDRDSQYKLSYASVTLFSDDAKISSWAKDSVYFMAANNIIKGMGDGNFAPRNTTQYEEASRYANNTREQALAIAVRMVENLGSAG